MSFIANHILSIRYIFIMVKERDEQLPEIIQLLMGRHSGGSDFLKRHVQKESMTKKLEMKEQKPNEREDDKFLDDSIR